MFRFRCVFLSHRLTHFFNFFI
ncbi:hypothetical protein CY0110_17247 [Crocosphaera chwakensis CCY0110]|uniref:Uncharacterized protein n=1 Tax=Crocosphaera chwakensis CCY0110 TaxID=391612 RepID=A3IID1_9CHRO|nr:hypothetical protein CY0110_17247 [Crocosphaera chwakensis CCY0110]